MEGQVNARLNITGNPSFFAIRLEYASAAPYLGEDIARRRLLVKISMKLRRCTHNNLMPLKRRSKYGNRVYVNFCFPLCL